MADTVRTQSELLASFADNNTGQITAQNVRDFIVTAQPDAARQHVTSTTNPHQTTASQVGAYSTSQVDAALAGKADTTALTAHTTDTTNPHQTTAAQVGAYTTSQVDDALAGKASLDSVATFASVSASQFNGGYFSGSFIGDGSQLYNLPVPSIGTISPSQLSGFPWNGAYFLDGNGNWSVPPTGGGSTSGWSGSFLLNDGRTVYVSNGLIYNVY
jgi:hypothetical protein